MQMVPRAHRGHLRLCIVRVQFLPQPVLKLQKSLRLPNSPLSLRMRYECPLEALDDPFRPPARFMFRCSTRCVHLPYSHSRYAGPQHMEVSLHSVFT